MGLTLFGFRYSVYTRIARMTLFVRGLEYNTHEVNPFDDPPDQTLRNVTPFQRVPVLDHDGFVLFETSAITRYLAASFPGAELVPQNAKAAARMEQVIAIVDAQGYWPMVRQVFSHSVFRPLLGEQVNPGEIADGLQGAHRVLAALEQIAEEGLVLTGEQVTLADLHLAPMVGYFAMAEEGHRALAEYPALRRWWRDMSQHPAYGATDPGLATLAAGGYSKT